MRSDGHVCEEKTLIKEIEKTAETYLKLQDEGSKAVSLANVVEDFEYLYALARKEAAQHGS